MFEDSEIVTTNMRKRKRLQKFYSQLILPWVWKKNLKEHKNVETFVKQTMKKRKTTCRWITSNKQVN